MRSIEPRRILQSWGWAAGCLAAALIAACSKGETDQPSKKTPTPPTTQRLDCSGIQVGPTPLRRLTRAQYESTIDDLFGGAVQPSARFPQSTIVSGFTNDVDLNGIDQAGAEELYEAAQEVAVQLAVDARPFMGCDTSSASADCLAQFLDVGATRVYRRPLDAEEKATLASLFDTVTADGASESVAFQSVLEAMLMSPQFLYIHEAGDPATEDGGAVRLDDYEVASRLSYFLWDSMPDAELFVAAERRELRTREQILSHAERMLSDPRARDTVERFHREWLQLGRLAGAVKVHAEFGPGLIASMKEDVDRFVSHVYWTEDGDLSLLLNGSFRFVDAPLASIYGVASQGQGFTRTETPSGQRSGLLTMAGFLAAHSHPGRTSIAKRGRFVREAMLCLNVPNPPDNVDITLPPRDPNLTTRQQLARHREDPNCAVCHNLLDPPGFAFEHYDELGRWRDFDGVQPVDASGEIVGTEGANGAFDGAVELSQHLASSPLAQSCVATQWLRFQRGRRYRPADACDIQDLTDDFTAESFNLRSLLVALTQTEGFLYRPVPDLEDAP